ncbi:MAG: hypothetical protein MZV64_37535 [Ignavibacteriales bacterium]|nr:hypothetical protein [Ignavibacteriales bacterium]
MKKFLKYFNRPMRYFTLLFLLSCIPLTTVFATPNDSSLAIKSYTLGEPLTIDGILDEPVYINPAVTNFIQKDPDEGKPATEKTGNLDFE